MGPACPAGPGRAGLGRAGPGRVSRLFPDTDDRARLRPAKPGGRPAPGLGCGDPGADSGQRAGSAAAGSRRPPRPAGAGATLPRGAQAVQAHTDSDPDRRGGGSLAAGACAVHDHRVHRDMDSDRLGPGPPWRSGSDSDPRSMSTLLMHTPTRTVAGCHGNWPRAAATRDCAVHDHRVAVLADHRGGRTDHGVTACTGNCSTWRT